MVRGEKTRGENIFSVLECFRVWLQTATGNVLFFSREMISTVTAKLSHTLKCLTSGFYSQSSTAQTTRHLFIYCHKQLRLALLQHVRSLRGGKETVRRGTNSSKCPGANSTAGFCWLASDGRVCKISTKEEERYGRGLWTPSLPLTGRVSPFPTNTEGNLSPLFITQLF